MVRSLRSPLQAAPTMGPTGEQGAGLQHAPHADLNRALVPLIRLSQAPPSMPGLYCSLHSLLWGSRPERTGTRGSRGPLFPPKGYPAIPPAQPQAQRTSDAGSLLGNAGPCPAPTGPWHLRGQAWVSVTAAGAAGARTARTARTAGSAPPSLPSAKAGVNEGGPGVRQAPHLPLRHSPGPGPGTRTP